MILDIILFILALGLIFWLSSHLISSIFYVPYVNSAKKAIRDGFKLADLKPGENFYDLGCGRGDALVLAANDFKAKAIGYEISPLPYFLARVRTFGNKKIKIFRRNIFRADLQNADLIYLYLLNSVLDKIEAKIFDEIKPGTRIVSLAFQFPHHKPIKTISTENLGRKTKIYLYQKIEAKKLIRNKKIDDHKR